jgi:hypothetical protein
MTCSKPLILSGLAKEQTMIASNNMSPIDMAPKAQGWAVAAAILLLTSNAFAQSAGPLSPGDGAQAPARAGNIYDHHDHQPTAADDAAAGIAESPETTQQVQKEVDQLLRQTDRLDREDGQTERGDAEIVR